MTVGTGDFPLELSSHTETPEITFWGGENGSRNHDEVNVVAHYIATLNGKKIGAEFSITLKKASCNLNSAVAKKNDDNCYKRIRVCGDPIKGCYWGACELNGSCGSIGCVYYPCIATDVTTGGCILWDYSKAETTPDDICKSEYHNFDSVECNDAEGIVNPAVTSSVDTMQSVAIRTTGATSTGSEDGSVSIMNTDTVFTCNESSIYSEETTYNQPGETEFYIRPARIETLTIAFPFNPQTPIGKILKDSIYNNLNSKYLSQLGTYFSYQPVVVTEKTMAFSTLCNSANCP